MILKCILAYIMVCYVASLIEAIYRTILLYRVLLYYKRGATDFYRIDATSLDDVYFLINKQHSNMLNKYYLWEPARLFLTMPFKWMLLILDGFNFLMGCIFAPISLVYNFVYDIVYKIHYYLHNKFYKNVYPKR